MGESTNPKKTLQRFLVEDFYTAVSPKKTIIPKYEEIQFEDFIVVNIVPPKNSTFNSLLLSLIRIHKDLR